MGYSIKYSNSNVAKTRRRGKVVIGTDSDGYEKTATSGLYTGVPPVEGKHNLVRVYSSTDPDFYVLDDTEIVNLANQLGANVFEVIEAKKYLLDRDDIVFTDDIKNDNIVTDSLVLSLDARVESSFLSNKPVTNLVSYPTMYPANTGSFIRSNSNTSHSNVGSSNWTWSFYPNSNVSDEGGMEWHPNILGPLGENGVWLMKKRTGGNSESNWATTAPGAIDETKAYTISYWCKTDTANVWRIHINTTKDGSSYWGYASSYHNGDNTWQKLTLTIPANSGNTSINTIRVQAVGTTVDADAYVKYYQVEEGETATDFVNGSRSETTTWNDLSGNGNNATFNNGVQNTFKSSKTFTFDGVDDHAQISGLTVRGQDNKSYEALIKLSSGFNSWGSIIAGRRSSTNDFAVYNDRRLRGSEDDRGVLSNTYLDVSKWYHVAYTFELNNTTASTQSLYINGKLDATGLSNSYNDTYVEGTSYIGYDARFSQYFSGSINSIKVYSKTLSSNEISQNYYGGDIVTNGLVYAMDAGNLVSYEENSTTTYSMTGSLSGSLINGVAYTGSNGGIWETDGVNDYVSIPGTGNVDFGVNDNFTIETWANLQTIPASGNTSAICCKANCCGIDWYYPTANTIVFRAGVRNATDGQRSFSSNNYCNLNQWYHLVFTYTPNQSDGMKLYIDGVLDASLTNVGLSEFSDNTKTYTIGGNTALGGTGKYSNIKSSITRMYNRALTADEVLQNYNAHKSRFI